MTSNEKDLKSKLLNIGPFPVQVWTEILLNLSYFPLLHCASVCTFLKDLINEDSSLSVQMFKTRSSVFVADPGPKERRGWSKKSPHSDPVRLHPAIENFNFMIGEKATDVTLFIKSDAGDPPALHTLALANELATIPAVENIVIELGEMGDMEFVGSVRNAAGIRLIDVCKALEQTTSCLTEMDEERVKNGEEVEISAVEDIFMHRFFEGLTDYSRSGTLFCTSVNRGS
ncbi:hypothetical protein C8J56DRAFT_956344 [Mycena floridula]|nr:hypothetical protein C8J56DRAFT_956344 [Mycena floridula]